LRDHGKKPEAIARYRASIAADSTSPDAHAELGALLVATRNHKDAAPELRTAVRLAPMDASAWYNLAFTLRETGQTAEAVEAYQRYITLKPTDPDPHYGLGLVLVSLGREDEALTEFRTYSALENRPTERRWLKKAHAEIARIESGHQRTRADDTKH
jgi:Flp pilus assembly protein TadD